jgi:predicted acetyltransferase
VARCPARNPWGAPVAAAYPFDVPAPTVRTITDDEFADFINVVRTSFLESHATPEEIEARRTAFDLERCLGAFDAGGRMCGVARAFGCELTVPGGSVAAGAVSSVGVLPTHRRQGHLTGMMRHQLDDIASRGEPVAVLVAAEYPIYGRYGYGLAAEACELRIDAREARWRDEPTGAVELVDNDTFAKVLIDVYDRARRATPGHITYDGPRWEVLAGVQSWPDGDDEARRKATKAVWHDEGGDPQAATAYSVDDKWVHNRPAGTLTAGLLTATSGRAELELLRFLTAVDWVSDVHVGLRPVDDPAPLALIDGRTARLAHRSDHLWVRVLDLPAALTGRRYTTSGSIVLEVVDPLGHAAGRFALEAGPDGATCVASDAGPDLVVPVGALGAAYVGGTSWSRLAAAGWVDERRDGAVAAASAMFTSARAPWCAMTF